MAESHGDAKGTTAHTEAGGGEKHTFPPFQKDTFASQLVSLLVAFVALYLIVSRIALPRVGSLLDERQDAIDRDLAAAEKTIASTREAAMSNVHGIASDAAAAIVQRLTGVLPDAATVGSAVDASLKG